MRFMFRSDSGDLHREGQPAIDLPNLKQYWWMGKLHNSRGPAVETLHASSYYWRGLHIEKSMWDGMHDMTAAQILGVRNAELRRVIIERTGMGKICEASKVLDKQEVDGVPRPNLLRRVELEGDEPLVFLELCNSTEEPDGTHKTYFLRVPPDTKTVREGVAWTFDIKGEYQFVYES